MHGLPARGRRSHRLNRNAVSRYAGSAVNAHCGRAQSVVRIAAEGAIRPESLRLPIPHVHWRLAFVRAASTTLWRDPRPVGQHGRRRCTPGRCRGNSQAKGQRGGLTAIAGAASGPACCGLPITPRGASDVICCTERNPPGASPCCRWRAHGRFWRLVDARQLRIPDRRAPRGAHGLRPVRRVAHAQCRPDGRGRHGVPSPLARKRRRAPVDAGQGAVFRHAQSPGRGHRRPDRLFFYRHGISPCGECRLRRQGHRVDAPRRRLPGAARRNNSAARFGDGGCAGAKCPGEGLGRPPGVAGRLRAAQAVLRGACR